MKYILLLFVLTITSCAALPELPQIPKASAEKKEVDWSLFNLTTVEGDEANLEDYVGNGQWKLMMIWGGAGGYIDLKDESDFHAKHEGKDIEVLGISMFGQSGMSEFNRFIDLEKPSFPNLVGDYPAIATGYKALTGSVLKGTPAYLLFDKSGTLKAVQVGVTDMASVEEFMTK